MRKAIAKIKLAPGNVAWYDSLTGIYLTMESPEAIVYDNQDIKNIKNAIRYNLISLREGTFPSQDEIKKEKLKETKVKVETVEEVKKEKPKTKDLKTEPKEKKSSSKNKKNKPKKEVIVPKEPEEKQEIVTEPSEEDKEE